MPKPLRREPKRLADLVRPALAPVLAQRGLAQASLLLDWPAIVGARVAAICEPARLQWPPRGPKSDPTRGAPGTLWLRVTPGRTLDVQYQGPVLIERVNAHLGWKCIARIAFAPEPKGPQRPAPQTHAGDPVAYARAADATKAVADDALRAALTRLGASVFSSRGR